MERLGIKSLLIECDGWRLSRVVIVLGWVDNSGGVSVHNGAQTVVPMSSNGHGKRRSIAADPESVLKGINQL